MIVTLRPAHSTDLPAMMEIERECFPEPTWREEDFIRYPTTVALVEERVVGFLVSRQTFPSRDGERSETEVLNVAVHPSFRRLGVATKLIEQTLESGTVCFLEVRESNAGAQALYRKLGFISVGRRPGYYGRPVETAIVMRMK